MTLVQPFNKITNLYKTATETKMSYYQGQRTTLLYHCSQTKGRTYLRLLFCLNYFLSIEVRRGVLSTRYNNIIISKRILATKSILKLLRSSFRVT